MMPVVLSDFKMHEKVAPKPRQFCIKQIIVFLVIVCSTLFKVIKLQNGFINNDNDNGFIPLSDTVKNNVSEEEEFDWKSRVRFFILGVQKGGTTSIFSYMRQHPHIVAFHKELRCFELKWDPKDPYCEKYMNIKQLREDEKFVTGDFSPGYL
jgi:hypothetical protein